MDFKKLALSLALAEKEKEIIKILKESNLWNDSNNWRYYGDRENNFGEIGNQQSDPAPALVEKIMNSIDAKLMSEVLSRNINPESKEAPQSIVEAQERFFNIKAGNLANITARERTSIAQNIALVATGDKSNPNYTIIDKGEGQTPSKMPSTILSLGGSNKLRIPFVQGKFNMGGTGSLQFCGKKNIQLVISKRDPKIAKYENDNTKDKWGFTIVRREDPKKNMKNSTFKYLAPEGEIPYFEADELPLWPQSGDHPKSYGKPLKWGTFIKLYEYDMTGMKTSILLDLYNYLSLLLPKVALPIRLYERRNYDAHSLETTLAGLSVRLEEDKRENLINNFPTFHKSNVLGQTLKVHIYAFKDGKEEKYKKKNEGILFTINGQTHGYFDERFFGRKNVGMDYIKNSLLVIVDCSDLDGRIREDTFMNSRDRLRYSNFRSEVERELEKIINRHPGLRELREKRKREAKKNQKEDSESFKEALDKILKNSPTFSKLFIKGDKLSNPFNLEETSSKDDNFKSEFFPSYFSLVKHHDKNNPKEWHIGERCRVKFKTDVENNFFGRDKEPGKFELYLDGEKYDNYSLNLWNGKATLNLTLPTEVRLGDVYKFTAEITSLDKVEPFINEFYTEIRKKRKNKGGGTGKRRKTTPGDGDQIDNDPTNLAIPEVFEINKEEWDKYGFDKKSALKTIHNGDNYDFYINMDNIHLLTEKKYTQDSKTDNLDNRFKYGMTLIGMALLQNIDDESSATDKVENITREISSVFLPMFEALADI